MLEVSLNEQHLLQAVSILSDTGGSPSSSAHLYLAQLADSPEQAIEQFTAALIVLRKRIDGFQTNGRSNGKAPAWSEAEAQARRSASRALVGMTELYLTDLWCVADLTRGSRRQLRRRCRATM